jgi:MoaD family protein
MRVTVKLFSLLRELVGNKMVDVDLQEGSTIEDLLEKMVSSYGLEFEKNIRHSNGLQVFLSLNGEGARLDSKLKNGDVVAFVPPVAGGSREANVGTAGLHSGSSGLPD